MQFRPLSVRMSGKAEEYDALVPGVPDWLKQGLGEWVHDAVTGLNIIGYIATKTALLRQMERKLRLDRPIKSADDLVARCFKDEDLFIDVVDFLLHGYYNSFSEQVQQLRVMLEEAGSAWTVGPVSDKNDAAAMLVLRVDTVVQAAVNATISTAGRAGTYLRSAWNEAYGRDPSSGQAYRDAVRAVEAAAKPIIEPKNPKATLGTMIRVLENKPTGWQVVLQPVDGNSVGRLAETMALLWTSQLDRHGTDDETVPLHVSLEEAQAAVHLAATLVQWLTSGAVVRV